MKILVLNAGSSSLKYELLSLPEGNTLVKGVVEEIGSAGSFLTHKKDGEKNKVNQHFPSHKEALEIVLDLCTDSQRGAISQLSELDAVGHRVVHGGETYKQSVIIDDEVIENIKNLSSLAPLHNPANLEGILAIKSLLPEIKQVAVFDTAFHQSMDPEAFLYPLPYSLYKEHNIRRYGFHGTSHKYLRQQISHYPQFKDKKGLKVITCHLGNGCSLAAIKDGKVIDTTMGFTPLDGLMMGTRSGTIDPAIVLHLERNLGMSPDEVDTMLNKKSGLLGVSEVSNDMRELRAEHDKGNKQATLALDIFIRRLVKNIGSCVALLEGVDAIVFAGGIGERGVDERRLVVNHLAWLGISLNEEANETRAKEIQISTEDSKVGVFVIPTEEELMIAQDTLALVQ